MKRIGMTVAVLAFLGSETVRAADPLDAAQFGKLQALIKPQDAELKWTAIFRRCFKEKDIRRRAISTTQLYYSAIFTLFIIFQFVAFLSKGDTDVFWKLHQRRACLRGKWIVVQLEVTQISQRC